MGVWGFEAFALVSRRSMLIIKAVWCRSLMRPPVRFGQTVFLNMQSACHWIVKRTASILSCCLCIVLCLATPAFSCASDESSDQTQLAVTCVAQSNDQFCETADWKSASQIARLNVKPEYLSRSFLVVLQARGLSVVTHPAGNLHREFSQPSLFEMGIALRL